jgi:integrase
MRKERPSQIGIKKVSQEVDLYTLSKHLECLDLTNNDNLNFWLYCKIATSTGLRSVDILEMKTNSIDFKTGIVQLTEKKTKKDVEFELHKNILDHIDTTREFVIWNEKYQTNVSLMTINRRLKTIYPNTKGISSHSIRKATAKFVYKSFDNDIIKAMTFLNHSSPIMTKNYLGVTNDEKREVRRVLNVFI